MDKLKMSSKAKINIFLSFYARVNICSPSNPVSSIQIDFNEITSFSKEQREP